MIIHNTQGMQRKGSEFNDEDISGCCCYCWELKSNAMKHSEFPSSTFLAKLPLEILLYVIRQLDRNDLLNLCCTCKELRSIFQPYIFGAIKASWQQLISISTCPLSDLQKQYIVSLRITKPCSKHEWTYPFHELFATSTKDQFRNLNVLELISSGSTSFFKYSKVCTKLKHLKISTDKNGSLFSLEHVRPFSCLESLDLNQFHISYFEEDEALCPNLRTLNLTNCTWDYPFSIENFGKNKILNLSLTYSNSFIMSERFRGFLANPQFVRLEKLQIINNERNLKLTISIKIMELIESIPTLKFMILKGNIYNETLHTFQKIDYENCVNYVALRNVKIFYSSFFVEK